MKEPKYKIGDVVVAKTIVKHPFLGGGLKTEVQLERKSGFLLDDKWIYYTDDTDIFNETNQDLLKEEDIIKKL